MKSANKKQDFHQALLGKHLVEDPGKSWNDRAHFKYYGLEGFVTIVGAWLEEGSPKVMVVDGLGHTAELYPTLYLLK